METKILIVDDELLIRQGIKHYISWEQEGFVVVGEASNGQEAMALIEELQPHIVVTDIVMPVMDGEELTKAIKAKYPEIKVIILSSYGEFEYVRAAFQYGAVDYVLKPKMENGELLKVLKKVAEQIPTQIGENIKINKQLMVNNAIEKLIHGQEMGKEMKYVHETFPYPSYYVIGLNTEYMEQKDKQLFQEKIKNDFSDFLKEKGIENSVYKYVYKPNVFIWLINGDEIDRATIAAGIEKVVEENGDLQFVCSNRFEDLSQLATICKENIQLLLNKQFFLPQYLLLTEEDVPYVDLLESTFQFELFAEKFRQKQFAEAFQYLMDYTQLLSQQHSLNSFEYKAFLSNSVFNITIELNHLGYQFSHIDQEKYLYIKKIDTIKSSREGLALLQEFVEKVQTEINKNNQNKSFNIKMVIDYIDKNYSDPLSLVSVAEHFHFHPAYFSNYFSNHNKEGFSEYVNKVRIVKASKLLENKQLRVSDIGAMVGYSDHSYFCKVFKKIKGISPSHYRRSIE